MNVRSRVSLADSRSVVMSQFSQQQFAAVISSSGVRVLRGWRWLEMRAGEYCATPLSGRKSSLSCQINCPGGWMHQWKSPSEGVKSQQIHKHLYSFVTSTNDKIPDDSRNVKSTLQKRNLQRGCQPINVHVNKASSSRRIVPRQIDASEDLELLRRI